MTDRIEAARIFREEALREGFSRVGIARAGEPPGFSRFSDWIAAGRHAGMDYLEATAGVRAHPEELLAGARSVVCLAAPHPREAQTAADGSRVARYAAGADYHGAMRKRAVRAARAASERIDPTGGIRWRVCVDSTPIAERSFAAAAGLGWIGKNGCLIDRELGSWLLLAEILTDADLPVDEPVAEACGSCVRCLEACPTDAFVAPGFLDANRCIAYWTIEHRGPIPDGVKPHIGHHVFGCDVCQEVCPWNHGPGNGKRETGNGRDAVPTRVEWLEMGKGEWKRRYGASAFNRAGRRGIQRNAAISSGAVGDVSASAAVAASIGIPDRGLDDAARWAAAHLG